MNQHRSTIHATKSLDRTEALRIIILGYIEANISAALSIYLLLGFLGLLSLHNLPPLGHHMSEQDIRTRNVDQQDQLQRPSILLSKPPRGFNGLVDQPALTANAQRV